MDRILKIVFVFCLCSYARAELSGTALEAYTQAQRSYSQAIQSGLQPSLQQNIWKLALESAEKAVLAAPKAPEPLLLRAQLFTRLKHWQKAEIAWRSYFANTEGSSAAMYQMSKVQFELAMLSKSQNKLNFAIAYFEQAVMFNPQYQQAWTWLGRTRYEGGRFALAAEACLRALEINPTDAVAIYYLKLARAKM